MPDQSINRFDGKNLKTCKEHTDEALEKAVGTSATCDETWRHRSFAERGVIVARVAALMHQKVEVLAYTRMVKS
ncbi:MAG: aldehyde dehydrogenase family protein [Rhodoferax sp.]